MLGAMCEQLVVVINTFIPRKEEGGGDSDYCMLYKYIFLLDLLKQQELAVIFNGL
jgi:hypothetical protein